MAKEHLSTLAWRMFAVELKQMIEHSRMEGPKITADKDPPEESCIGWSGRKGE